eukprot:5598819-Amphidinium_carterae.1
MSAPCNHTIQQFRLDFCDREVNCRSYGARWHKVVPSQRAANLRWTGAAFRCRAEENLIQSVDRRVPCVQGFGSTAAEEDE